MRGVPVELWGCELSRAESVLAARVVAAVVSWRMSKAGMVPCGVVAAGLAAACARGEACREAACGARGRAGCVVVAAGRAGGVLLPSLRGTIRQTMPATAAAAARMPSAGAKRRNSVIGVWGLDGFVCPV